MPMSHIVYECPFTMLSDGGGLQRLHLIASDDAVNKLHGWTERRCKQVWDKISVIIGTRIELSGRYLFDF